MLSRGAFVGTALAAVAAASPPRARAFVTSNATPGADSADGRLTLEVVSTIVTTQAQVRTVWRPPAWFEESAPIARYVAHGDANYPNEWVIWLNADHPESVSPRLSRLTDEIPLFTELLLASVDAGAPGKAPFGLGDLAPDRRRIAATTLAGRAAVVAKFSPYQQVDDLEFAHRQFAFSVLRQLTPRVDEQPDDRSAFESWVRGFVFAAAERRPPRDDVKHAYDAARAVDAAAASGDRWAARRAFAAPYVTQVAALFGR